MTTEIVARTKDTNCRVPDSCLHICIMISYYNQIF